MKVSDVVSYFGSAPAAYKALGVKRSAFSQWGDDVPKYMQYKVQVLTNGVIKADEFQPQQAATA